MAEDWAPPEWSDEPQAAPAPVAEAPAPAPASTGGEWTPPEWAPEILPASQGVGDADRGFTATQTPPVAASGWAPPEWGGDQSQPASESSGPATQQIGDADRGYTATEQPYTLIGGNTGDADRGWTSGAPTRDDRVSADPLGYLKSVGDATVEGVKKNADAVRGLFNAAGRGDVGQTLEAAKQLPGAAFQAVYTPMQAGLPIARGVSRVLGTVGELADQSGKAAPFNPDPVAQVMEPLGRAAQTVIREGPGAIGQAWNKAPEKLGDVEGARGAENALLTMGGDIGFDPISLAGFGAFNKAPGVLGVGARALSGAQMAPFIGAEAGLAKLGVGPAARAAGGIAAVPAMLATQRDEHGDPLFPGIPGSQFVNDQINKLPPELQPLSQFALPVAAVLATGGTFGGLSRAIEGRAIPIAGRSAMLGTGRELVNASGLVTRRFEENAPLPTTLPRGQRLSEPGEILKVNRQLNTPGSGAVQEQARLAIGEGKRVVLDATDGNPTASIALIDRLIFGDRAEGVNRIKVDGQPIDSVNQAVLDNPQVQQYGRILKDAFDPYIGKDKSTNITDVMNRLVDARGGNVEDALNIVNTFAYDRFNQSAGFGDAKFRSVDGRFSQFRQDVSLDPLLQRELLAKLGRDDKALLDPQSPAYQKLREGLQSNIDRSAAITKAEGFLTRAEKVARNAGYGDKTPLPLSLDPRLQKMNEDVWLRGMHDAKNAVSGLFLGSRPAFYINNLIGDDSRIIMRQLAQGNFLAAGKLLTEGAQSGAYEKWFGKGSWDQRSTWAREAVTNSGDLRGGTNETLFGEMFRRNVSDKYPLASKALGVATSDVVRAGIGAGAGYFSDPNAPQDERLRRAGLGAALYYGGGQLLPHVDLARLVGKKGFQPFNETWRRNWDFAANTTYEAKTRTLANAEALARARGATPEQARTFANQIVNRIEKQGLSGLNKDTWFDSADAGILSHRSSSDPIHDIAVQSKNAEDFVNRYFAEIDRLRAQARDDIAGTALGRVRDDRALVVPGERGIVPVDPNRGGPLVPTPERPGPPPPPWEEGVFTDMGEPWTPPPYELAPPRARYLPEPSAGWQFEGGPDGVGKAFPPLDVQVQREAFTRQQFNQARVDIARAENIGEQGVRKLWQELAGGRKTDNGTKVTGLNRMQSIPEAKGKGVAAAQTKVLAHIKQALATDYGAIRVGDKPLPPKLLDAYNAAVKKGDTVKAGQIANAAAAYEQLLKTHVVVPLPYAESARGVPQVKAGRDFVVIPRKTVPELQGALKAGRMDAYERIAKQANVMREPDVAAPRAPRDISFGDEIAPVVPETPQVAGASSFPNDKGVLLNRTEPRMPADATGANDLFYFETRIRPVAKAEGYDLAQRLGDGNNSPKYVLERRRVDVRGGNASVVQDWTPQSVGQSVHQAVTDSGLNPATFKGEVLSPLHKSVADFDKQITDMRGKVSALKSEQQSLSDSLKETSYTQSALRKEYEGRYQQALKDAKLYKAAQEGKAPPEKLKPIQEKYAAEYRAELERRSDRVRDMDKEIRDAQAALDKQIKNADRAVPYREASAGGGPTMRAARTTEAGQTTTGFASNLAAPFIGATAGALAPAQNAQDRARNAAIGAGVGLAGIAGLGAWQRFIRAGGSAATRIEANPAYTFTDRARFLVDRAGITTDRTVPDARSALAKGLEDNQPLGRQYQDAVNIAKEAIRNDKAWRDGQVAHNADLDTILNSYGDNLMPDTVNKINRALDFEKKVDAARKELFDRVPTAISKDEARAMFDQMPDPDHPGWKLNGQDYLGPVKETAPFTYATPDGQPLTFTNSYGHVFDEQPPEMALNRYYERMKGDGVRWAASANPDLTVPGQIASRGDILSMLNQSKLEARQAGLKSSMADLFSYGDRSHGQLLLDHIMPYSYWTVKSLADVGRYLVQHPAQYAVIATLLRDWHDQTQDLPSSYRWTLPVRHQDGSIDTFRPSSMLPYGAGNLIEMVGDGFGRDDLLSEVGQLTGLGSSLNLPIDLARKAANTYAGDALRNAPVVGGAFNALLPSKGGQDAASDIFSQSREIRQLSGGKWDPEGGLRNLIYGTDRIGIEDNFYVVQKLAEQVNQGRLTAQQADAALLSFKLGSPNPAWLGAQDAALKEQGNWGLARFMGAPVSHLPAERQRLDALGRQFGQLKDAGASGKAIGAFMGANPDLGVKFAGNDEAWKLRQSTDTGTYFDTVDAVNTQYRQSVDALRNQFISGTVSQQDWKQGSQRLQSERDAALAKARADSPYANTQPSAGSEMQMISLAGEQGRLSDYLAANKAISAKYDQKDEALSNQFVNRQISGTDWRHQQTANNQAKSAESEALAKKYADVIDKLNPSGDFERGVKVDFEQRAGDLARQLAQGEIDPAVFVSQFKAIEAARDKALLTAGSPAMPPLDKEKALSGYYDIKAPTGSDGKIDFDALAKLQQAYLARIPEAQRNYVVAETQRSNTRSEQYYNTVIKPLEDKYYSTPRYLEGTTAQQDRWAKADAAFGKAYGEALDAKQTPKQAYASAIAAVKKAGYAESDLQHPKDPAHANLFNSPAMAPLRQYLQEPGKPEPTATVPKGSTSGSSTVSRTGGTGAASRTANNPARDGAFADYNSIKATDPQAAKLYLAQHYDVMFPNGSSLPRPDPKIIQAQIDRGKILDRMPPASDKTGRALFLQANAAKLNELNAIIGTATRYTTTSSFSPAAGSRVSSPPRSGGGGSIRPGPPKGGYPAKPVFNPGQEPYPPPKGKRWTWKLVNGKVVWSLIDEHAAA